MFSKDQYLVSVITPCFNSQDYILSTINSVENQTYKNWELILVDDASTDKTIAVIEKNISQYSNILLIKNAINQGAGVSRNKGIEAAKGDFIAFLDADDLWKPEKLERQISLMNSTKIDVCYSSYDLINENGNKLNKRVIALPRLTYRKLLKSNYIGNLTGIYNCKTLGKIQSTKLRKRQDWILWLEALKRSKKPAIGIQEPLAYYRIRENSMSANKLDLVKYNFNVFRKGLGFSLIQSITYFIIFLFEHFFIKSKQLKSLQKN